MALYALVLFNPIAFDTNINRYYRDVGYYAVSFLAISGLLALLTHRRWGVALAAGAALSLAALVREDSQWLYIYAAGCLCAVFVLTLPRWRAALRCTAVCTAAVCAGWLLVSGPIMGINFYYYGTAALDEYNSGSYAQAYGALSRLDGGLRDSHITIPYSERIKLYEESTAFAELYPCLDAPDALYATWKEVQGEYRTGYFSFVLRSAAEDNGRFETAETADAYFTLLAQQVNAYADTRPDAGPRRSGVVARFYPEDLPAVLSQWGKAIGVAARFQGLSAVPIPAEADDAYLQIFETYTGSECAANRYMADGTVVENYHPTGFRLWMQRGCRVLILVYQCLTPVLLAAAALGWLVQGLRLLRRRPAASCWLPWVAQSSLLCAFLVREAMLAYVDATTFSAIANPAYQAASYPVMLAFIALTAAVWAARLLGAKR